MKTSLILHVGEVYTRKQLMEMFGISDATIRTGVFHPKDHESIWLFVTENKTPDRTQYVDFLEGDILYWQGQTRGRTDHFIIRHKQDGQELLVFYRHHKAEHPGYGFRYEGCFEYVSHEGQMPASFVFQRVTELNESIESDLAALQDEEEVFEEGGRKPRLTNRYERNQQLRLQAVSIHGTTCMVCGFDFERTYGEWGKNYIEVHHITPVSSLTERIKVNPATDMVVVCANCHRMLHRKRDRPLSLDELKVLLQTNNEPQVTTEIINVPVARTAVQGS